MGQVIASERRDLQAALDKRDREIKLLRRELGMLRTEVALKLNLKAELAAARAEIDELRQRAPSFEVELAGLREKADKQAKLITRLRSGQSQMNYTLGQLETAQRKDRREVTLTVAQASSASRRAKSWSACARKALTSRHGRRWDAS
jgi:predicted RNase H-like nuclease (RuvC/YqgF family)